MDRGPVNWDLANQSARQVVAAAGDKSVSAVERRTVDDAFRLADTWLDQATAFPATGGSPTYVEPGRVGGGHPSSVA